MINANFWPRFLAKLSSQYSQFASRKSDVIGHFTVKIGDEAAVDLVLIQPFLHYYPNDVVLMLTSIFYYNFYKKRMNKVNLSLTFTQRLGHSHNREMVYYITF